MGLRTERDNAFVELGDRSERGLQVNWHKLLRSGHSAADIVADAEWVLRQTPDNQLPSLGGFLARYETRYADARYGGEERATPKPNDVRSCRTAEPTCRSVRAEWAPILLGGSPQGLLNVLVGGLVGVTVGVLGLPE